MAASLEEDDEILKSDYYALLNVDKKATIEEINNAFRHLSKIYHPDKHVDPIKKKKAEEIFNKLRKAHDVLRDKSRRTIYDMYGEKGLETGDMEIIARTKTPAEIIAEYERIQKEREERRLQQRTNPRGTITVGINASDLFDAEYGDDELADYRPSRSVEISSMSIAQSVECPLTLKDTIVVGGNLDTRNGIGQGMFSVMWRRLLSTKGWAELDIHVGSAAALGITGFRQLTQRCYLRCSLRSEFSQHGYRPSAAMMLAYQFDRNLQGRLTYNLARPSSVTTNIIYSNEQNNLSTTLQLGIRNSFFSMAYTKNHLDQNAKYRGSFRVGTLGTMVEVSIEKKITDFSHVGGTLLVGVPHGVHLKLKMLRGQQTFFFPIYLSDNLNPSAILYGAAIPIISYFVIKNLIINPILKQQKQKELEKQKEDYAERLAQKRAEAEKAVELMKETYERCVELEEKKSGLVIVKSVYGKLQSIDDSILDSACVDVTIPIQALVKDSKLILPETSSKSGLPGFYDPFIGEEKKLYIRYLFRGRLHQAFISDTEPIRLPQQKHLIVEERSRSPPRPPQPPAQES
ncbi:dnaJ subfamily C member 11 [Biomphalaria glabrata]|uniref:DnaJ homolog subfamily C member 11-like n=1 Tax=Biomphalaria glabrata TaxID=6526 RepID=A0A2C9LM59_BIOGL|nr:dnaJ homolog subfamily C member 11-like [Biomphalaria glabrata]KAI8736416.1 dnaJ-like protein subfamily C member 11-like [Biomphalaria glabrata]KAI8796247.1 dnaJ subfamily C member 11 [Biomphalaria glabrata]